MGKGADASAVHDCCDPFLPLWIAWESTPRCNLSCVHCRCSADLGAFEGRFTTELAKWLISEVADLSKPAFVFSGGEPLLRDDIFELGGFATDRGLRSCLATNGMLIDDDVCLELKRSGFRIVAISLDGPSAEIHDDFRRHPGAFSGAVAAVEKLAEHGIEFIINSSFARKNQRYIRDTFRLAKSLGAKAWYMFMIVPTGRAAEISDSLISKADYEEILKWHYYQEKEEHHMLMRPTCAPHYYRVVRQLSGAEGRELKRRSLSLSTGGAKGCLAAQSICLIDSMGEVKPCSYFDLSAGNVFDRPFAEIWHKSRLMRDLRSFADYRGKCGRCEYLPVCGGCRARALAEEGDYMGPEPYCDYCPPRARFVEDGLP